MMDREVTVWRMKSDVWQSRQSQALRENIMETSGGCCVLGSIANADRASLLTEGYQKEISQEMFRCVGKDSDIQLRKKCFAGEMTVVQTYDIDG